MAGNQWRHAIDAMHQIEEESNLPFISKIQFFIQSDLVSSKHRLQIILSLCCSAPGLQYVGQGYQAMREPILCCFLDELLHWIGLACAASACPIELKRR